MKYKNRSRGLAHAGATPYVFTVEERLERDLLLTNNPVLISGLALAPVIGAANTLKNGIILSIAAIILITPVRALGNLIIGFVPKTLRAAVYAAFSAAMYIPAYYVLHMLFGIELAGVGLYLPMLVVDSIVLSRSEIPQRERGIEPIRNGFLTSLGFAAVAVLMGAAREVLGEGKIYGITIPYIERLFPVFATPAGGFIIAALLAAGLQAVVALRKRAVYRQEREHE